MTQTKRKTQDKVQREEFSESEERGTLLSLSGIALDIIGKIALAAGTTALLLFLFTAFETLIGLGTLTAACIAVGTGAVSMVLGNKLKSGLWIEGLLTA